MILCHDLAQKSDNLINVETDREQRFYISREQTQLQATTHPSTEIDARVVIALSNILNAVPLHLLLPSRLEDGSGVASSIGSGFS